ncbi:threonine/serine exporter family protein [Luteococcus sanguinis]|uniref:Threonine/serine exporter ThrE family protein n=1 Tax=Luteococcus sanguinis TaxID=174038 RepID=A0ABW1X2K9_9ACTN
MSQQAPEPAGESLDPSDLDHPDRDLIGRTELVMRAGTLMLTSGTSSLRVAELMRRVAKALELDTISTRISFTDIGLTVSRGGIYRTQVSDVPTPGVNAQRIASLQELSRDLPVPSTPQEVARRLGAVERSLPQRPDWLMAVLVALACASVAVLANGGWREVAAVLPASAVGYLTQRWLLRRKFNLLAVVMSATSVSCGGFVLVSHLLDLVMGGQSPRMAAGFICAAIFLIPGFPLVTGGLDLGRIDLHAGIPRVAYAAMVLLAMAIGVWLLTRTAGVQPDVVAPVSGHLAVVWLARLGASFFAVFGWAMMFNSPVRVAMASGAIAMVANAPRLVALDHGVANHVATFFSCFAIGLLCAVVGRWFRMERIIMTVPTVLVSIPGSSALRTLVYFDRQDVLPAVENGVATVLVVVAMVAGLLGALMLTESEWAFSGPRR